MLRREPTEKSERPSEFGVARARCRCKREHFLQEAFRVRCRASKELMACQRERERESHGERMSRTAMTIVHVSESSEARMLASDFCMPARHCVEYGVRVARIRHGSAA